MKGLLTNTLPRGWIDCKIGDITLPVQKIYPGDDPDREITYIDISSIDNVANRIGESKSFLLLDAPSRARQIIKTGDVLFSTVRPYLRNIAAVRDEFDSEIASTGFSVLRPADGIEPTFLFYKAISADFVNALSGQQYGVIYPAVKDEQVRVESIALPPSDEQRRIVAKLEELFSELDKGVESLLATRDQLTIFRAAVLDEATGNKSREEFGTYSLASLIGNIQQGWSPKCDLNRSPTEHEWAVIKTTAVQPMHYKADECKPLPGALDPRPAIEIRDGDILMTRKGPRPRTGVVCLVEKARPRSMLCDTVYRFRANEDIVLPSYLEIALNAPRVVAEIDRKKSGINDSGISLNHGRIKAIQVRVPECKDRQQQIVRRTEERLSKVANLHWEVEQQIARAKVLKQAILKRALSGQLLAQDPNDEPALALLERIKSEKAEQGNGKDSSKRRDAA